MPARAKAEAAAVNNDVELDAKAARLVVGSTTIADHVIETIAGLAAREVPGVYKLGRGPISNALSRLRGTHEPAVGVRAEVGRREVAIDMELIVDYGFDIHETAAAVREIIGVRLGQMTHLTVKEVNISVVDIHLEEPEEAPPAKRVE